MGFLDLRSVAVIGYGAIGIITTFVLFWVPFRIYRLLKAMRDPAFSVASKRRLYIQILLIAFQLFLLVFIVYMLFTIFPWATVFK